MAGMPDRNFLISVFQQVDRDRSGVIDATELQSALSNGAFTPFNPQTVRLMISMFDRRGAGTINFDEFGHLWKYVTDWQQCFRNFDRDRSGSISRDELKTAVSSFGYRFSDMFFDVLMQRFDRTKRGTVFFDDFIQCCIVLHNVTQEFSKLDTDRDGVITVGYETFLQMVLNSTIG